MSHTPGPWQVTIWKDAPPDNGHIVVETTMVREGAVVAFVRETPRMLPEEVLPNASLIAAAPELLAACEALSAAYPKVKDIPDCPCGSNYHPNWAMVSAKHIVAIRRALAKAKGAK